MTRIKICGIKDISHAMAAAEAGADFIGLVFARSPRQVTPEQARRIAGAVRKSGHTTEIVGVFVNTPSARVNEISLFCKLDWVQLSGDEPWHFGNEIHRPVIIALRVDKYQHPDIITGKLALGERFLTEQRHLYLLDSHTRGSYGGTGTTFDWHSARQAAERFPLIIAGGLTPDNVTLAIETIGPWGVDVSSGVETDGAKDVAKIRALIERVRRIDDERT
jgi:phosphoribosylanthranilate isomerase